MGASSCRTRIQVSPPLVEVGQQGHRFYVTENPQQVDALTRTAFALALCPLHRDTLHVSVRVRVRVVVRVRVRVRVRVKVRDRVGVRGRVRS